MCHYRFMNCNKYSTLMGDIYSGGGYTCVGTVGIWKICIFSSQFFCEPKTALKKITSFKKIHWMCEWNQEIILTYQICMCKLYNEQKTIFFFFYTSNRQNGSCLSTHLGDKLSWSKSKTKIFLLCSLVIWSKILVLKCRYRIKNEL